MTTSYTEEGTKKALPISGGGRHRPFYKLTDDVMLRHSIRRERQEQRRRKRKPAMKGIVGATMTEQIPYPPLQLPDKQREPGQPTGLSGSQKRRARRCGNPEGLKGEGRTLKEG